MAAREYRPKPAIGQAVAVWDESVESAAPLYMAAPICVPNTFLCWRISALAKAQLCHQALPDVSRHRFHAPENVCHISGKPPTEPGPLWGGMGNFFNGGFSARIAKGMSRSDRNCVTDQHQCASKNYSRSGDRILLSRADYVTHHRFDHASGARRSDDA